MKLIYPFVVPEVSPDKSVLLEEQILRENIQRSKLFAKIVIMFESILILMQLSSFLTSPDSFVFNTYFFLYLLLWTTSIIMLFYMYQFERSGKLDDDKKKRFKIGLLLFVSFFLTWGAIVTLFDQREYGHVMAFAVNVMCVSILFYASNKTILFLYSVPVAVLLIGLPFFQTDSNVVFGHYINLVVFIFFCWLASRMLYTSFTTNFINKLLLTEANESLSNKITENEKIYEELAVVNKQLQQMAVLDELTQIPNRRSFKQHIEAVFVNNEKRDIVLIMTDIDAFKLFNDHYGHLEGDQVIRTVASTLEDHIVKKDHLVARYGGEEFVLVFFDVDEDEVYQLAEVIRQSIFALKIPHAFSPAGEYVSISMGIASGSVYKNEVGMILESADKALYKAKATGRNRVEKY